MTIYRFHEGCRVATCTTWTNGLYNPEDDRAITSFHFGLSEVAGTTLRKLEEKDILEISRITDGRSALLKYITIGEPQPADLRKIIQLAESEGKDNRIIGPKAKLITRGWYGMHPALADTPDGFKRYSEVTIEKFEDISPETNDISKAYAQQRIFDALVQAYKKNSRERKRIIDFIDNDRFSGLETYLE